MEKVKVLDFGYVQLIETWGSEESIIEAARMSTGKGFLGWGPTTKCSNCEVEELNGDPHPYQTMEQLVCQHLFETKAGDEKLLKYLYNNKHFSPFEFGGMILEIQAPIMVFREFHRHRTFSFNEMSARYTPLPDVNYVPTVDRLLINSKINKQAGVVKGAEELTPENAELFREELESMYRDQENFYQRWLNKGVPKELARVDLPVGRYSRMRASASLRNWLQFLTLRMDPAAQYEIRMVANAASDIIKEKFPRTWELFEAQSDAVTLNRDEAAYIKGLLAFDVAFAGETPPPELLSTFKKLNIIK